MAAYASVLSLLHTLEQIQNHTRLFASFDDKQIDSLRGKLAFLQDFLERYSCGNLKGEARDLERQIVDAAYGTEDVIESLVVDLILDNGSDRFSNRNTFLRRLQKAIKSIDSIKKKAAVKMQDMNDGLRNQQTIGASGAPPMAGKGKDAIVGLDDDLIQIMERLTGQESALQVIPIVGMGGIGKTTLARAVYENPVVVQHFDIRIWITLGQEHTLRDVLLQIPICKEREESHATEIRKYLEKQKEGLGNVTNEEMPMCLEIQEKTDDKIFEGQLGNKLMQIPICQETQERNDDRVFEEQLGNMFMQIPISQESLYKRKVYEEQLGEEFYQDLEVRMYQEPIEKKENKQSEEQLGETLHKDLFGRRYLVVIDDMWSTEVWDKIKCYFPSNGNTSRIVVTTRLLYVANLLGSTSHKMNFLDVDKSWKLFCENAFLEEDYPLEFEKIGKMIVHKCRGLPLLIVVIGKLLAKSHRTPEHWESVAKDINSFLNSEYDEHCLNILSLSYFHLPTHLKPCFLYTGTFSDDLEICVSKLMRLWIDEGFLKPDEGKSLEDVAEGYLKDLVDRNLILVRNWKLNGKIKTCYIHDLLKDLCLRVAQEEKFICVPKMPNIPKSVHNERRVVIHEEILGEQCSQVFRGKKSMPLARSLICKSGVTPLKSKLMRVLNTVDVNYLNDISQYVNLRHIAFRCRFTWIFNLTSSISLLWNLQTLICHSKFCCFAPPEIWKMKQLKHVEFHRIYLPDPLTSQLNDQQDDVVLGGLHTLLRIINFKSSEEVLRRIPYIKNLKIRYEEFSGESMGTRDYHCLHNLGRFQKLESLHVFSYIKPSTRRDLFLRLTFPCSLKKLTLENCALRWDDLKMIGSLPYLEVLKLEDCVKGQVWNPIEDQFHSLKYLRIHACIDLIYWKAESSHFPILENLDLGHVPCLKEIPLEIGEIPTLQSIRFGCCRASAAISAMKMLEEQESQGNEDIQVRVSFINEVERKSFLAKAEEEGLMSNNFQYA